MKTTKKILLSAAAMLAAVCCAFGVSACGEHEHEWGEWSVTTQATCETAGKKERVCAGDSSHKEEEAIPALGHSYGEWTEKTPATCTEAKIEERVCSNDGTHKETRTVGEALGHKWDNGTVTTQPTEDVPGVKTYKCTVAGCDGSKTESIPELGHDWGEWTEKTPATCSEAKVEERVCSHDTTHKETRTVGEALGHGWGSWAEKTPATCSEAKVEERVCSHDTTHKETRTVGEALGHGWGGWAEKTPATCTEAKVEERVCSHDGTHKETRTVGSALGHDWKLKETVAATCKADGILKYECGNAGCTEKKQEKGADKLPHNWGAWTVIQAATPEASGEEKHVCPDCGAEETRSVEKLNTGYKVTVLTSDGKPVPNVTVYLDEEISAQTDDKGIARFEDDLVRGNYTLEVDAVGYGLLEAVTTSDEYAITVTLFKTPQGSGASYEPLKLVLGENGSIEYLISVGWTNDKEIANQIVPEDLVAQITNTGNGAAQYTISVTSALSVMAHEYVPIHSMGIFGATIPAEEIYAPVTVVLEKGENYKFNLTANVNEIEEPQNKGSYPVVYTVTVTRSDAPAKGSTKEYMYTAVLGDNEYTVDAEEVFVKLETFAIGDANSQYRITFDESVSAVEDYGYNINNDIGTSVESGALGSYSGYYAHCLKVYTNNGVVKFNIEEVIPLGTKNNPIEFALGESVTAEVKNTDAGRVVYYKYTNDTQSDIKLTFVPDEEDGGDTSVSVYKANNILVVSSITGMKVWFTVPAGETYVLGVHNTTNSGNVAFLVREYDENEDVSGDTYVSPVILRNSVEFTGSFVTIKKYYKIITSEPGYYTVSVEWDASEDAEFHIASKYAPASSAGKQLEEWEDIAMEADHTLYREEREIWIVLSTTDPSAEAPFRITYVFEPLAPAEHTVTVKGEGLNLEGLTVELKKDSETVATGTTDGFGVAAFNVVPYEYKVVVTGFDAEYSYNSVTMEFNAQGCNVNVFLSKPVNYTFTVKDPDGEVVGGVTVKVDVNGTVVSGETNEDGVFVAQNIVPGVYPVTIEGLSASYYFNGAKTSSTEFSQDLTLKAPYNITHENDVNPVVLPEGTGTIKNSTVRTGRYDYIFTATEAGDYTITIARKAAANVGIENLYFNDADKSAGSKIISGGTFSATVNEGCGSPVTLNGEVQSGGYGYLSITVHLEAEQFVIMSLKMNAQNATATVEITKN